MDQAYTTSGMHIKLVDFRQQVYAGWLITSRRVICRKFRKKMDKIDNPKPTEILLLFSEERLVLLK